MKKLYKQKYRVECNFGCRYFDDIDKALAYFWKKAIKHLDVEIWLVTYIYYPQKGTVSAKQELLDYETTSLTKG